LISEYLDDFVFISKYFVIYFIKMSCFLYWSLTWFWKRVT